ncbi:HAD-IC family P-type ATPase, partial [Patescibacteria group bacterium]|nr:HAD-IC family P-type ATPase [Patescibacteria group bacterium]
MEIENGFTKVTNLFKHRKVSLTVLSGIILVFGLFLSWFKIAPGLSPYLYLTSLISGGIFVYKAAFEGIKEKAFFNINLLVTIASIGAFFINQWAEAASVVFFFSLAEMFEEFGIKRSQQAIRNLIEQIPQKANKKEGNKIVSIPIEEMNIDDIVVIKPGDKIPLDGKVVKGNSAVDEASITGESLPKEKFEGDLVFAGTLNMSGYLEVKITKKSKDTVLSKVVATIEEAQEKKAPSQEFIDRFAFYYTPTIVIGAVFLTVIPTFLGGVFTQWLYRSLTLLVIACPCALVISTPVSIASAIGRASQKGALIKGGRFLEAIGKVKAIAFDKTRTLTVGKPVVSDILTFNGFSKEEVLADAYGIGKFDTHPLSSAIKARAEEEKIDSHKRGYFCI